MKKCKKHNHNFFTVCVYCVAEHLFELNEQLMNENKILRSKLRR